MSYALVFSGQGLQHPGMLPWLADDGLTRAVNHRLGVPGWRDALHQEDWAARNTHAQVLLTGLALAAWEQLAPRLPAPAAVAGYSVGELAAFSAAGLFDAATALSLAQARAEAMDRCAAGHPGGLLGVSHLAPAALNALLRATGLAVAIRNAPDSVVLGGPPPALEQAEALAVQQGGRCTRLRVGLASHTPALQPAAEAFRQVLEDVPFARPRTALFSNAADRIATAAQARDALAAQIARTVRWDECMENLQARGVRCVLEVGPGQALARMWNTRHPGTPARACDEFRSADSVAAWVAGHLGG
ncbi:ACP S-malonyltransferase [Paracidovorax anthurii]|uniref:[acyl-carrier-protein] S-malonyltransferase n=1 Tax=Paracidovorax anthurii TaxID=78229 RepID=A0A328Z6Y7_9BURK|nr:acyltransferase domain-containing protein [Paracidovorax anthurii]RAR78006.1 [acyl-carrier-protein] S-malonyltransferase [Paracidovorax anthurii]